MVTREELVEELAHARPIVAWYNRYAQWFQAHADQVLIPSDEYRNLVNLLTCVGAVLGSFSALPRTEEPIVSHLLDPALDQGEAGLACCGQTFARFAEGEDSYMGHRRKTHAVP